MKHPRLYFLLILAALAVFAAAQKIEVINSTTGVKKAVTMSGNATINTAGAVDVAGVSLTTDVTGTLPIANGGTAVTEFPKVRATQVASPAQAIANNSFTKVNWGTESEDTGADFASGTFTAPRTGHVIVTGSICWTLFSAGAAQSIIEVYKNGSSHLRMTNIPIAISTQPCFVFASIVNVTANDTVEIYVYQNSGSSQNLEGAANTHLEIAYLP
jgi:hypothetical protein